jgi:Leucine-rich repeat (LRR) protein
VTNNKNIKFIASEFCKDSELNKISKINDETFVGLEKLEYLDLSNNNVRNISLPVLHRFFLPQTEMNTSEVTCVSKVNYFNLSSNAIYSFNFGECHSFNLTPVILCTVEISESRKNCLSVFDDNSVKMLTTAGALIYLIDECSLSQDVEGNMYVTSLIFFESRRFKNGKMQYFGT